jgi:uncharacterized phiE125 gp8 family phage protein
MAIYINGTAILADGVVEPVSLTDAKNWMRIDYTSDDTLIQSLINASRIHIEKLTGVAFVNKLLKSYIQTTGFEPSVWMVDLPYGPVICIDSVKIKTGINSWESLTKNDDYEVIAGKLWLYTQGNYEVQYQSGYSSVPEDIASDILALVAWQYENRGKKMNADPQALISQYPNWDGLNYHQYKKVVI